MIGLKKYPLFTLTAQKTNPEIGFSDTFFNI